MKIAVAFPGVHRRGGVERVAYESARFLARVGHEVTVFAGDYEVDPCVCIDYRETGIPKWPAYRRPAAFFKASTRRLATTQRDDGPFDALASFGCVCPLGGVYWAQSVHAAWMEHSRRLRPRFSMLRWKQRLNPVHSELLRLEQLHLGQRRYRKVIALTDEVRRDLRRFYDVPSEDVVVLPNGFSPEEFNPENRWRRRAAVRAELGYADSDRVVVFVANELERKGFGPLLRGLAATRDPRARLLVVGRVTAGAYGHEIARLGYADRVRFVGPTSDVMKYYAAADVFALPTQYEAWGMVIIEAAACGLPVITSRLAGAAVAIREGGTGRLLDDPADVPDLARKLQELLAGSYGSPEHISDSVQAYAWPRILAQYEHILLGSSAGTQPQVARR